MKKKNNLKFVRHAPLQGREKATSEFAPPGPQAVSDMPGQIRKLPT
jgi:hypothetical protein